MPAHVAASSAACTEALAVLGVHRGLIADAERRQLDEQGYVIIPGVLDAAWLDELRATYDRIGPKEIDTAAREFHRERGADRLADLVNKGAVFDRTWLHPLLLSLVHQVIGRPFKLSALSAREAQPGQGYQALHTDWGERAAGDPFHVANGIWALDDLSAGNGAPRLVPGSHRWASPARQSGTFPEGALRPPEHAQATEIVATCPAGSLVFLNSHTWHGGTVNTSGARRRVLHAYYCVRDHVQQLDQAEFLRVRTAQRLSPAARWLLET